MLPRLDNVVWSVVVFVNAAWISTAPEIWRLMRGGPKMLKTGLAGIGISIFVNEPSRSPRSFFFFRSSVLVNSVLESALHFELEPAIDIFLKRNLLRNFHIHPVHRHPDDNVAACRIDRNGSDEKRRRLVEHGICPLLKNVDDRRVGPVIEELVNAGCGVTGYSADRVCARQRVSKLLREEISLNRSALSCPAELIFAQPNPVVREAPDGTHLGDLS